MSEGVPAGNRGGSARAAIVVGACAALGLWGPVSALLAETPAAVDPVQLADDTFSELRAQLAPGDRIGVLVAARDPNAAGAMSYSAQYALAPAVVEPVYLLECLSPSSGSRCRLDSLPRVAVVNADPELLSLLGTRLGLQPVGAAGAVVLVARTTRGEGP